MKKDNMLRYTILVILISFCLNNKSNSKSKITLKMRKGALSKKVISMIADKKKDKQQIQYKYKTKKSTK